MSECVASLFTAACAMELEKLGRSSWCVCVCVCVCCRPIVRRSIVVFVFCFFFGLGGKVVWRGLGSSLRVVSLSAAQWWAAPGKGLTSVCTAVLRKYRACDSFEAGG